MKVVLIANISYITRIYNLLSKIYFGSQSKLYIETIIYYLIKTIDIAKNKNKIESFLMINIFVTYPNMFS